MADAKLWEGAAAAGWRVVEMATRGSYKYIAPSGTNYKTRSAALEARDVEGGSAEAMAPTIQAGKAAVAGGKKGKPGKAAKVDAAAKGKADVSAGAPKG